MASVVVVTVEDVADKLTLGYTTLQLYSANTINGSYGLVSAPALVAGTYYYEISDSGGSFDTWYKYRFTDGVSLTTGYSDPFRLEGMTRKKIRQTAIEEYDAGLVLLASGGDLNTVLTTDRRFKSSTYSPTMGQNNVVRVTSGARAGEESMVTSSSSPSTGTIEMSPDLTGALGVGDEFELHWLADPQQWDRAINRGLARIYTLERVPIVGVSGQDEYSLADLPWLTTIDQVKGLWHYPQQSSAGVIDGVDQPWGVAGRWWKPRADSGAITLSIAPTIDATKTLYLEATRAASPLYSDDSVAQDFVPLDLIVALTYDEVLAFLSRPATGASKDREKYKQSRLEHASATLNPLLYKNRVQVRPQPPVLAYQPVVPTPWTAR